MIGILQYDFMQRAFIVSALLSIVMPLIGIVIVNKNISVIGDALSHTSLVGVMFGVIIGINPVITSIVICIIASVLIEYLRSKFPGHSSISTTIVMSFSIGLASVLTDFVRGGSSIETFLFGSIVAVAEDELFIVILLCLIVFLFSIYYYRELQYISFDEEGARVSGINVKLVNFIFTILTAITIAVGSRTIGVMIISSMLIIPVACAIQLKKSYFQTIVISSILGFLFMISGLILSYYLNLKPGGTTIIIATLTLIVIIISKDRKRILN